MLGQTHFGSHTHRPQGLHHSYRTSNPRVHSLRQGKSAEAACQDYLQREGILSNTLTMKAALLGAGIFARDVYAKLFVDNAETVVLEKVWSRSSASAEEFVTRFAEKAQALHGDDGLEDIMRDPEIKLVVVVLPVQGALPIVRRALKAGKHVIEEKPVAADIDAAMEALRFYHSLDKPPLWMLAENYRYEDVFQEACRLAPSTLGKIIKLDLVADMAMDKNNKYYSTSWRREDAGVAITESSVHFVAALRMLAAACGLGEATEASARTSSIKPDLSGPDSMVGTIGFQAGSAWASVSITLGASQVNWYLKAVGTSGSIEVSRGGWTGSRASYTLTWKKSTDAEPTTKSFPFVGVQKEFSSFLKLIAGHGDPQVVQDSAEAKMATPEEGARDLALVQALLQSGARGGEVVKVMSI